MFARNPMPVSLPAKLDSCRSPKCGNKFFKNIRIRRSTFKPGSVKIEGDWKMK
jgi:hypothetical protein